MTIAWMLYVLVAGSLIALGATALDGLARHARLPTRWVWLVGLAGIVTLALIAPGASLREVQVNGTGADVALESSNDRVGDVGALSMVARARSEIAATVSAVIESGESRIPQHAAFPLLLIWACASAGMVSMLAVVTMRFNRARKRWPIAEIDGSVVRIAATTGPAVIGFARPDIVVPRWLLARPADEQRLVVVHEREHIAARDQLLPVAAWVIVALVPWHPAAWYMLSRMRLAIELDCDARVLARGIHARPYASLLIDIAGQCAGHRVGALALADASSHLERRLLAMKHTTSRRPLVRALALGAVAALSVLMACEARVPTAAEIDKMDVASVEKKLSESALLEHKARVYYVDGVEVAPSVIHAMSGESVARIEVRKAKASGGKDEIHVSTEDIKSTLEQAGYRPDSALSPNDIRELAKLLRARRGLSEQAQEPVALRKTGEPLEMRLSHGASPVRLPGDASPLILIDGVVSTMQVMNTSLDRKDILSVEVIKGAAAAKMSTHPAALNGVINITTNRAKKN